VSRVKDKLADSIEHDQDMEVTPEAADTRPQQQAAGAAQNAVAEDAGGSTEQRRAIIEQLAQRLVDELLDDAYELYLCRELQQTAEESVKEALAATGAGEF
jgi:hypothetical protein